MTDQNAFTTGLTAGMQEQSTQTTFQNTDQVAGDEQGVDTKDPQYQVQVMQKRLDDSQEFIKTLQEENQNTREMYASLAERMQNLSKIEEVLNKQGTQDANSQDITALDKSELVGDVIKTLHQEQAEMRRKQNFETAKARLASEFGSHVEEKVTQAAEANGMTYDDMVELAHKSPTGFYKLVGIDGNVQPTTPQPTHGTTTTPPDKEQKDYAYFSRLMRENPQEWKKPEVQREFRSLFINKDKGNS